MRGRVETCRHQSSDVRLEWWSNVVNIIFSSSSSSHDVLSWFIRVNRRPGMLEPPWAAAHVCHARFQYHHTGPHCLKIEARAVSIFILIPRSTVDPSLALPFPFLPIFLRNAFHLQGSVRWLRHMHDKWASIDSTLMDDIDSSCRW